MLYSGVFLLYNFALALGQYFANATMILIVMLNEVKHRKARIGKSLRWFASLTMT